MKVERWLEGGRSDSRSDVALLQALCRRGADAERALDALYRRHSPTVFAHLLRRLEDPTLAADVLVEAFSHLWRRPEAAPVASAKLAPWLVLTGERTARRLGSGKGRTGARRAGDEVCLDDILITCELDERPTRPPNLAAENAAFVAQTSRLADGASVDEVLSSLVDAAIELCGAGTAGLSMLDDSAAGGAVFRWTHMAGELSGAVGGTTPRNFSPCGVTLDRAAPQLFNRPARYFSYFDAVPVPIVEGLVIPFGVVGEDGADAHTRHQPTGTLWIVSHDGRRFDREDARIMSSLTGFTAVALQIASR